MLITRLGRRFFIILSTFIKTDGPISLSFIFFIPYIVTGIFSPILFFHVELRYPYFSAVLIIFFISAIAITLGVAIAKILPMRSNGDVRRINEQLKLSANIYNTTSAAIIVGIVVNIAIYNSNISSNIIRIAIILAGCCHLFAYTILSAMRDDIPSSPEPPARNSVNLPTGEGPPL